ncbi:hypothetical protein [Caenispirillum bisanense]|uniref:hypothetical protein n=1 Tax=Caenispirillum bisanense TaxID=414052 RepID=UPI0031E0F835
MYWRFERKHGEEEAVRRIQNIFGNEYPEKGMAFALGTHSRYPASWLLIGVLRLDRISQLSLF